MRGEFVFPTHSRYRHPNGKRGFFSRKRMPVDLLYALRVVGFILLFENVFLVATLLVSLGNHEWREVLAFAVTMGVMTLLGALLLLLTRKHKNRFQGYREGALAVVLTWLTLSLIGMLPFLIGEHHTSLADAFFETVSGFTTTGFTTFLSVESLPRGILFWRSIIQWQGGIGIVVFTMGLSPLFSGDGGLLYNAEVSGITHERFLPRIKEVANRLGLLYLGLTVLLVVLLCIGKVPLFDAVCHAFSTISSGGFSTRNEGIPAFHSSYIEYVLIFFMIIASLNLSLIYQVIVGKPKSLYKDEEFRWFIAAIGIATAIVSVLLVTNKIFPTVEESFRQAFFQVVSITSSTGYYTSVANTWGAVFLSIFIPLMFVCGCAGSTSGGLKMSRFMVMIKNLRNEFKKRIHPSMVTSVRFNGVSVASNVVMQVLAFISLYLIIIVIGTVLVASFGNNFTTSFSNVISAISNIGYGFGSFSYNFAFAGSAEKFILALIMLAGRLEVFTFVGILMPSFYRR